MRRALGPLFQHVPLNQFRNEVDRLVSDFFGPSAREWQGWLPQGGSPRLNVWEENDALVAEAEVPGLKSEDLDLSVVGDQLTIRGKREATKHEQEAAYHRRERTVGEFVRSVTLPVEINADDVTATLDNGVLTVRLPKAARAKPRKINVS